MIQKIIVTTVLVLSAAAWADSYHNVNQIVGDRALGFAGAYTAISDDPAGMYYNPAGIAHATSASISANVNTIQTNSIVYDDALGGTYDYRRSSFQVLPNFFGVVQPFKGWVVGFSNAIVDSTQEKQDQKFENFINIERFVVNLNNLDSTYNVGPTVAKKISSKLSIGLSAHLHYRSSELISNQYVLFDNTTAQEVEWTNTYFKTSEQGFRPKLGISYTPLEKLSLGLTIDKTWVIRAEQTQQVAQCISNNVTVGCATQIDPDIEEFSDKRQYPWQVRLGAAWFASSALIISGDAIFNTAVPSHQGYSAKTATLDGALGLEWYWSPQWALRSGIYTAFANTKELSLGNTFQDPHVNRYGGSFGITRFSNGSSISLGVLTQVGQGDSQLFADQASLIQNTQELNMTAYFTTSYRY